MIWFDFIKGIFNLSSSIKFLHISKFPKPLFIEDSFDLAEHILYGVVIRGVGQVKDRLDVQLFVGVPSLSGLMDTEVVHEDRDRFTAIYIAEPVKVLNELVSVEGLLLYGKSFNASSFCDGGANAGITSIYSRLIYFNVTMHIAPSIFVNTKFSEVHFIQPKDFMTEIPLLLHLE